MVDQALDLLSTVNALLNTAPSMLVEDMQQDIGEVDWEDINGSDDNAQR
jgi:hypothetical protein